MIRNSIRFRLLVAAGLMILIVLLAVGSSIVFIFQRHLEKRVHLELEKQITQLLASVEVAAGGKIVLSQQLADPRFSLPLSGLYWQIDLDGKPQSRSQSLGDQKLVVPTPPSDVTDSHVHELAGPDGQNLYSLEQAVYLVNQDRELLYVVTVGLERGEISDTVLSMTWDVVPALAVLGFVMLLGTWLQVTLGLRPLSMIEKAIHGIRDGSKGRLDDEVAAEVKPLVNELNALLAANEKRNRLERQRAADLAHGLRTPLTILGSISRKIIAGGMKVEAEKINIQTEHMRQQVERELARALSSIEEVPLWIYVNSDVNRLVKVVAMAATEPDFMWTNNVPEALQWRITRNDFNELLGNILENAQKWGRKNACVRWQKNTLIVEDDGPGVPTESHDRLTVRGFTTGENSTSSGLGLSIAKHLADKNDITLTFARAALGGLAVQLKLPPQKFRQN